MPPLHPADVPGALAECVRRGFRPPSSTTTGRLLASHAAQNNDLWARPLRAHALPAHSNGSPATAVATHRGRPPGCTPHTIALAAGQCRRGRPSWAKFASAKPRPVLGSSAGSACSSARASTTSLRLTRRSCGTGCTGYAPSQAGASRPTRLRLCAGGRLAWWGHGWHRWRGKAGGAGACVLEGGGARREFAGCCGRVRQGRGLMRVQRQRGHGAWVTPCTAACGVPVPRCWWFAL
jgi:hypothetical protein